MSPCCRVWQAMLGLLPPYQQEPIKEKRKTISKIRYGPLIKCDSSEINSCSNKTFFVLLNPNTRLTSEINVEEVGLCMLIMKREIREKEGIFLNPYFWSLCYVQTHSHLILKDMNLSYLSAWGEFPRWEGQSRPGRWHFEKGLQIAGGSTCCADNPQRHGSGRGQRPQRLPCAQTRGQAVDASICMRIMLAKEWVQSRPELPWPNSDQWGKWVLKPPRN